MTPSSPGYRHGFTVQRATTQRSGHHHAHRAELPPGAARWPSGAGADLVILGDHDDIWHRNRIEHQVALLAATVRHIAMLASDGFLIDEHGAAVPGTIRSTFPIPDGLQRSAPARHSSPTPCATPIATGGASALRPSALTDWTVPTGWLHDRWWSLAALRAAPIPNRCHSGYRLPAFGRSGGGAGHRRSRRHRALALAQSVTKPGTDHTQERRICRA